MPGGETGTEIHAQRQQGKDQRFTPGAKGKRKAALLQEEDNVSKATGTRAHLLHRHRGLSLPTNLKKNSFEITHDLEGVGAVFTTM